MTRVKGLEVSLSGESLAPDSALHTGEPAVGIVAVLRLLILGVGAGEDVVGAVVAPTA
jgi:hypothetical protein